MGGTDERETWPPAPQGEVPAPEDRAGRAPLPCRRGLKALAALTMGLGVFPYLIYVPARLLGALPDERTWDAGGGTGSPWGYEPLGILLCVPMLLLPFLALLTLLVCVVKAVESRRGAVAALGAGLALAQLGLALLQLGTVFWAAE